MLGRNDKCLCGSEKKYKKCCINRELELSSDIEYCIVHNSDDEKTPTQKIKEMPYEKKIEFLSSALKNKEAKCLDCKKGSYEGQGAQVYVQGMEERYEWFCCDKCNSQFSIEFNGNFVTEISDFDDSDMFLEDYSDLELNDNIEEFFGLDFEDMVLPKLNLLQIRKPGFTSLPAIGEFETIDNKLVFNMLVTDEETIPFDIGQKGINGLEDEIFDNIDKIRGRIIERPDSYQMVIVLSDGNEEEAELELDRRVCLDYLDYRGVKTKEDMIELLEEADIEFMNIGNDDFDFDFI